MGTEDAFTLLIVNHASLSMGVQIPQDSAGNDFRESSRSSSLELGSYSVCFSLGIALWFSAAAAAGAALIYISSNTA